MAWGSSLSPLRLLSTRASIHGPAQPRPHRESIALRQVRMLRSFVLERCRIGAVTDHAIVVADADGTITCWSPVAEVLFGHSAAAAVGQKLDLIMRQVFRAPLDWLLAGDAGASGEGSGC